MTSPIRFALCGCGHIASRWLDVFQEDSNTQLVAVADPDPTAFQILKNYHFPHLRTFSTIEEAWTNVEIDAVVIATPPQYHSRYIIEAIEKGYHVLSEKPMCVDEDQFTHLLHANNEAKKKGLVIAINQQYRWNPRIEAIHNAVQANQLGDIFLVNSHFNQNNYHFQKWWRQQQLYISLFNWYVHQIDTMRFYLQQNPVSVSAKFIRPTHSKIVGYSTMLMDVTFEKGTVWHITANQEAVAGPTTSGHADFTMYGSQGTLINTKNDPPFLFTPDGKKTELGNNIADLDNANTYPPGWPDSVAKFIDSIRNKTDHPTSLDDNCWTMAILLGAIRSFEQHREIQIREFFSNL